MAGYSFVNKTQALLHSVCKPGRHSSIPAQESIE
jgi:hypothetical protein